MFLAGKIHKSNVMKKYESFNTIKKADIEKFSGLDNEMFFAPWLEVEITPIRLTRFGITYPNENYYIKRASSPCFIIEYIVSGEGYIEINGEKHKLEAGDAYIIHQGDFCEYYSDKKNPYKKYWINLQCMFFFTEMLKAYDINDRVIKGIDLSKHFEEIFKLEQLSDRNDELYIPLSKIVFNILMDIALHKKLDTKKLDHDIAYHVKTELDKSVTSHITIEEIAKNMYHSKNEIIRQFKKHYKITPYNYLIEQRILRAKNILVNTDKNLSEIASYLCFSSEYHFSNCFKKKVGISPREYRKSSKELNSHH